MQFWSSSDILLWMPKARGKFFNTYICWSIRVKLFKIFGWLVFVTKLIQPDEMNALPLVNYTTYLTEY